MKIQEGRFKLLEQAPGLFKVEPLHPAFGDPPVGFIARGQLRMDRDGSLIVRGARWVVLGFEYVEFRHAHEAAEALYRRWKNLRDADSEHQELRRLIGVAPVYKQVSKHTKDKATKKRCRQVKLRLHAVRAELHASLDGAGISSLTREGGSPLYE